LKIKNHQTINTMVFFTWMIVAAFACPAMDSTLVRRGRLEKVFQDDSELRFGGGAAEYSAGNGCSTNTYYETCSDVAGTQVGKWILNGDEVTYCGRYRAESNCNLCNSLGCTITTPVNFGGSTITYRVVSSSSGFASLAIDDDDWNTPCSGVCTDPNNELRFLAEPATTCTVAQGWVAVSDNYDEPCTNQAACQELEVKRACEGSSTGSKAGIYRPSSCSSYSVRTVYERVDGGQYILHNGNQWIFNSFCSELSPVKGYFDAGNEPYQSPEAEVECFEGGYGDNKDYSYYPLEIICKKRAGNGVGSWSASNVLKARLSFTAIAVLAVFVVV